MDPVQERKNAAALLQAAAALLEDSMDPRLLPPEGAALGHAIRNARDSSAVALLRLTSGATGDHRISAGIAGFGTDDPVVRALLTVLKIDQDIRSAAQIQYSDRAIGILKNDLFLECASFDAGRRDRGISTMDWGIASCCRDEIPDAIAALHPDRARSRIVLFGEVPSDVTNNIIICSNRI